MLNKVKIKCNQHGRLEEFKINDIPMKGVTDLTFHTEVDSIPSLTFTIYCRDTDIELDDPDLNCTECQCLEDCFNNKEL